MRRGSDMFTIVGGVYRENCLDPAFDEILGSGGRAAIAVSQLLSGMSSDVHFHTVATPREIARLGPVLQGLGINFHAIKRSQEIQFQYNHSVDKAVLFPDYRAIEMIEKLG